MLCLRKHVCGKPCGVGRRIGQHQHFAGARNHVYAYNALHKAFGRGNKNVAGASNNIHRLNGLRAVGHGRNGPCAANAVDFVNIKQMRSRQNMRVYRAVLAGRGKHGKARHTRHLGGNGTHEQA